MPVSYQGFTYNRPCDASFEEAAGMIWQRSTQTPGIGFARKQRNAAIDYTTAKGLARTRVVDLFASLRYPDRKANVLSMPGLFWKFERQLMNTTFRQLKASPEGRQRMNYFAVESDPAIFRASLQHILGSRHVYGLEFIDNTTIGSRFVHEYKCITIERYAEITEHRFDAAWLDFNGFITPKRVEIFRTLWSKVDAHLVVTLMEARQSKSMSCRIVRSAGLENLLSDELQSSCTDVYRYNDGVPMVQMTWSKAEARRD